MGKEDVAFEYFLKLLPKSIYIPILKFRTSNHKLPIETGRWEAIPYQERKCFLCIDNEIGDEFHYLFTCPYFANERHIFLKPYYYRRPNIYKYKVLMNSRYKLILCNLAKFINIIMNKFQ